VEGAPSTCAHGPDKEKSIHVPFRSKSFGIIGPKKTEIKLTQAPRSTQPLRIIGTTSGAMKLQTLQ
jgi:hypothetical protein